mgnify:CR=1 FL=1
MVLTNYSKLQADEVVVRFFDGTDIEGSLYGADTRADLAIVAVPLDNLSAKIKEQMKVISFGDSGELSVGSMIFAFGSPNGALYSVEYGYVSGQETEKSIEDYQLDVYTTNMGYHSDGNGIICNAYGELLGMINRQSDTTENCTFYGIGKLKQLVESILNKEKMQSAKKDLCVLHPLPRVNEISTDIDNDSRACYFKQVEYGKYMRMAIILKLLSEQ